MICASPLRWPLAKPRRLAINRKDGRFSARGSNGYLRGVTIGEAINRVSAELSRIRASKATLTTNLDTRSSGIIDSRSRRPDDPGVALYFTISGEDRCLPCDTFNKVEQNIAALAAHIEATRAIERHGVGSISEMFEAFKALPAPEHWTEILGLPPGTAAATIQIVYRGLAKQWAAEGKDLARLNVARDEALKDAQ